VVLTYSGDLKRQYSLKIHCDFAEQRRGEEVLKMAGLEGGSEMMMYLASGKKKHKRVFWMQGE
jgi:hypothetical protein